MNYPEYPHLSGALISGVTGLLHNRIMTPNMQEYLSLKNKISSFGKVLKTNLLSSQKVGKAETFQKYALPLQKDNVSCNS